MQASHAVPCSPARTIFAVCRGRGRHALVPVLAFALAAGLALVGARGSSDAALPVKITVRSADDPLQVGATTTAEVDLYNHGDHDIRPRFSLSWLPYPYYWRVESGPPILGRGERATYRIAARDAVSAPRDGDTFQIKVNDANSITYAVSKPIQKEKTGLPIINPALRLWTQRDPSSGLLSPAGWQIYQRRGAGDTTLVEPIAVFGVDATRFRVTQDGNADAGGWAHTGLTQEVPFPEQPFALRVLGRAPYHANAGGWPLTAFGMEVADARNGLIWLLFQQTNVGDLEYDLPSGHHIVVYDVPKDQWAAKTVDLQAIYHRLNWVPSKKVTLKLFAAAASSEAAEVEGYVSAITLVDAGGSRDEKR